MADAISTKNVWPYYAQGNTAATKKTGEQTLGKDDFLKILVTQLKNQDPMQPLQDREFIAQMAQFSSVEQLMNMATEMKTLRQSLGFASNLIGHEISWKGTDAEATDKSGIVDSIVFKNGIQLAKVGGDEVPLDQILTIKFPQLEEEPK